MRIIPVLDVMGGQVVRAVGGRRAEYRPIQSRLTGSTDPEEVTGALLGATGSDRLYLADIDAILRTGHRSELAPALADRLDVPVLFDPGIRTEADIEAFPLHDRLIPVIASETLERPEVGAAAQVFEGAAAFSVDLRDGHLLGPWETWYGYEVEHPRAVVEMARAGLAVTGASVLIVIDLARVGARNGSGTEGPVRDIRDRLGTRVQILVGGGVRNWDDVRRLEDAGADGVLVASALHDGTLTFPRPVW